MRCKFCFATFQDVKKTLLPKGHLPKHEALNVVKKLAAYGFKKITFAGGEPLLCPWLPELIKVAKELGMTTMIVTNGSQLTDHFLIENKNYLDWIAISIDSLKEAVNLKIGRAITGKRSLTESFYKEKINLIKNYGYGLKINTVVNSYNHLDDFNELINFAKPKRWKVLQVLPIVGQNDIKVDSCKINRKQFDAFVVRHSRQKSIIPESNNAMRGSYVMIDPAGRFFDNSEGKHNYSDSIISADIENTINEVNYSFKKFIQREGIYEW
jgi:radical S-adenosyl methionine domain-containing protein 2